MDSVSRPCAFSIQTPASGEVNQEGFLEGVLPEWGLEAFQ